MNDLVSIITPSYNTALYIGETIDSVLKQTYPNWEMLIVDDCSSDNSVEIVKGIITRTGESRIKLFVNKSNVGAAESRNRALCEAKGKWIAFLDSDDLWLPYKIEKQMSFMRENNYYFTYTEYLEIDEYSRSLQKVVTGPKKITKKGMYRYCWPGCLTVMYDAEYIGLVKIKEIAKNNDYAMWLQIIRKVDCYLLKENLAMYRKRPQSLSNHNYFKLIRWHYRLFHNVDNKTFLHSMLLTAGNMFWGIIKKVLYVRNSKNICN